MLLVYTLQIFISFKPFALFSSSFSYITLLFLISYSLQPWKLTYHSTLFYYFLLSSAQHTRFLCCSLFVYARDQVYYDPSDSWLFFLCCMYKTDFLGCWMSQVPFYFMDLSMQLLYLRTFKPSTAAVKIPYQSEKWWETCRELQSLNSILKVVHNGGCHAVKFHFCRSERFHYQRVLRKTLFFFTVFPVCLPRHWLGRKKMLMCTIVVFSWKAQQFISSRYVILVVTIFTPQITNGKEQNVTW